MSRACSSVPAEVTITIRSWARTRTFDSSEAHVSRCQVSGFRFQGEGFPGTCHLAPDTSELIATRNLQGTLRVNIPFRSLIDRASPWGRNGFDGDEHAKGCMPRSHPPRK